MKKSGTRIRLFGVVIAFVLGTVGLISACSGTNGNGGSTVCYDSAKSGIKAYDLLSLGFSSSEEISNPYDASEIAKDALVTGPDGTTVVVPMFWYQDYERNLRYSVEELTEKGEAYWALRYTPTQKGRYTVSIRTTKNGKTTTEENVYSVDVQAGNKDGFLRVASDHTYLEFSNGRSFTGIGHNLCGWEWAGVDNQAGTYDYDKWFNELKASGANMAQFDLCEGDNIEWTYHEGETSLSNAYGGVGYYNQMAAWKTDYKVAACDNMGLYYRFSLYHWEDFDVETGNYPDWGWARNPYNAENGGPCESVSDFFESEEAKAYTKNYIRYCVARWGYSTNMIMWELWNEADSPDIAYASGDNYSTEFSNILQWHDEMAQYVKSLDVNKHLVTTSFANAGNASQVWNLESIDVTTFHRYSMYNSTTEGIYNGVGVLTNIINSRLLTYNKPVIAGEFALSPGGDIQRENDPEGIGFHNQIWASLFAGSFGTAMHWTWGSYVDRLDLYDQYTSLSALLGYEDLRGMMRTNNVNISSDAYLYMTMQSNDRAFLWVKDRNYDYLPVAVNGYKAALMQNIAVSLTGLDDGAYEATFYDTWNGEKISSTQITVTNGNVSVEIPDFYKDVAVKVIAKAKAYAYVQLDETSKYQTNRAMSYWSDTVALSTAGNQIGGTTDQGGFAYISLSGDFDMIARVSKCAYLGASSKAGIMMRSGANSSAPMAFIGLDGAGDSLMLARGKAGEEGIALGKQEGDMGDYVKLERRGNSVKGCVSADGITWTELGTYEFAELPQEVLIGVAASSNKTSGYNEALFECIKITNIN